MKKLLLFVLLALCMTLGYSFAKDNFLQKGRKSPSEAQKVKTPILRFALVADSENDNDLLTKALNQAKGSGVNFVIGLGDWSSVGTIGELTAVKKIFDASHLTYYMTPGDHDLWDSRDKGDDALTNYKSIFGSPSQTFTKENIQFVIVDNSDIYNGIDAEDWQRLQQATTGPVSRFPPASARSNQSSMQDQESILELRAVGNPSTTATRRLTFVFAHKTPFHPQSAHVMGEDSAEVAKQAKKFMDIMEEKKVDGFFCGDLHFFAQFNSPAQAVKMTTIGAVDAERNFQGPRYGVVTVFNDYTWNVEDVEIR